MPSIGAAVLLLGFLLGLVPARADDVADALAVFREYVSRSERFDPTVADLYADDAAIRTRRIMPDGTTRDLSLSGAQLKSLIRQVMPLAKERGDRNTFRNVAAKPEGRNVIVTAERYSQLKGYSSPFALLLSKDRAGNWWISAEVSETRP
jgi:hypothetical protein